MKIPIINIKELDKYFFKKYFFNFFYISFFLISIIFLVEFVELLRRTSETTNITLISVFYLALLKLTESIGFIIPIVFFITTGATCKLLSKHHEMVVNDIQDWLEKENPGYSQCWVSGFSFGSLICMQLIMRRPEVNKFIAISPQPNVYDFTFLAPCPISGLVTYGKNDELVPEDSILNLKKRLSAQKNIDVKFDPIANANHFYKKKEKELSECIDRYLKDKISVF